MTTRVADLIAHGVVKKACALGNQAKGRLADWKAAAIIPAAIGMVAHAVRWLLFDAVARRMGPGPGGRAG